MSLFSYIDTSAPSTEDIMAVETEYNEDGTVKEPSFVDAYELRTELSLQRVASLLGSLSIVWAIVGLFLTGWFTYVSFKDFLAINAAKDAAQTVVSVGSQSFALNSLVVFLIGLAVTAIGFALLRLARGFANFMIVRMLQCEEPEK